MIILVLAAFWNNISGQEQLFVNQPKDSVVRLDPRAQQFEFVPGEILIKFKDEAQVSNLKVSGIVKTGLASVDDIFFRNKVSKAEKLFPKEQRLKSKIMLKSFNGHEFEQPSLHNIYKLTLPQESNLFEAIEELKQDPNIIYAEPNYILSITDDKPVSPVLSQNELQNYMTSHPDIAAPNPDPSSPSQTSTPNDPLYSQQWYIPAVKADLVWDSIQGADSSQVIAIIDTGVDWLHPDLQNKIWTNPGEIPGNGIDDDGNGKIDDVRGWDWINNDNNPTDDNSHGTHVAGIAAAEANNGIGICGVSQGAKIMPLKVFQSSGKGDAAIITQGIIYAKDKGATVINMSFGSYAQSFTMEEALANAYATCVLVAAAGNDNKYIGPGLDCRLQQGFPFYPAALSFVLGTQASINCGLGFSNYDNSPVYSDYYELYNYELVAPGVGIISTVPNGNYRLYHGTSMAAPVVSGAVCQYKSIKTNDSQELLWGNLIYTSGVIYIDIDSAIRVTPVPRLMFVSKTMVDSIGGADNDGMADAGEIIQLWFKVRNTWGQCDSVMVHMGFDEFEDTTTVQFIVSTALIGSTSTYASNSNQENPLEFQINPNVAHNRDIRFRAMLFYPNSPDTVFQSFIINVSNGSEISGILLNDTTLTPDKLWLINNNLRISTGVTLTVLPGTHLEINAGVDNRGTANFIGNQDSLIYLKGYVSGNSFYRFADIDLNNGGFETNNTIEHCNLKKGYSSNPFGYKPFLFPSAKYCVFEDFYFRYFRFFYVQYQLIENCIIQNSYVTNFTDYYYNPQIKKSIFSNITTHPLASNVCFGSGSFEYTVFNNIIDDISKTIFFGASESSVGNSFLGTNMYLVHSVGSGDYYNFPNQYWGTNRSDLIREKYYDFMQDVTLPYLVYEPKLEMPSDSCHAHVWKVLVNGADAQDEYVEPIGIGPQRFDVYFNRGMDTTFTPQLSFGVRFPYTQQMVTDSAYWSTDHKIWTAYKTIQLYTGDGINRIRVAGAKEANGWEWEIPVEDMRFEFLIAAAGSASMEFMAQAGIGKVYLEWNNSGIPDLLGFNMYRFNNITDTTFTAPEIINSTLITDTTYTDFAVTPGEHYWYYYKVVNTDFRESDSSNLVNAIPYDAPNGDANGDGLVNVLDVTALIAYMLDQNPQPFLFDAADVNDDNSINILDVIGVVNIITGNRKSISISIGTNPLAAHIKMEDDQIMLQHDGQIASIQFELAGEALENIKLAAPPHGFELAYGIVKGKLLAIIYTSDNKTLPKGTISLARVDGQKDQLIWGKILAGDKDGNVVPVLKDFSAVQTEEQIELQAYPNPFSRRVTVSFRLPENSKVELKVYNMQGMLVDVLLKKDMMEGEHSIDWNGTSMSNKALPSGIYFCKLEGYTKSGNTFSKVIKMIFVK